MVCQIQDFDLFSLVTVLYFEVITIFTHTIPVFDPLMKLKIHVLELYQISSLLAIHLYFLSALLIQNLGIDNFGIDNFKFQ